MKRRRRVISLFTGAGGLDLGLEAAGFSTAICVEIDPIARATLARNRPKWKLAEPGDIHQIDPDVLLSQAGLQPRETALLAGGPPCQPFSKSMFWVNGDAPRLTDPRASTLHAYLRIVDSVLPEVILVENVKGLAFAGKDEGLRLLLDGLTRINKKRGVSYQPAVLHLNAADYGVPQLRERVIVLAHRDGRECPPPPTTHAPPLSIELRAGLQPYRTAWDAIGDLDSTEVHDLAVTGRWADLLPSIPEGKNYQWHTRKGGGRRLFAWRSKYWSFLLKLAKDQPAWTIQALPGPATGPFHWSNRRLSVRELARLQSFPDDYDFNGDYRTAHRQIGNAVPPALGELLGRWIRRALFRDRVDLTLSLAPALRPGCPPPEREQPVPQKYVPMEGDHVDHPGTGRGPGAQRRNNLTAVAE